MSETIIFPDAETLLIQYLNARYTALVPYTSPALEAHTRVPTTRPDRFTLVRRVGGTKSNMVMDRPTFIVESWSLSAIEASAIAQLNRGLINAIDTVTYASRTYQFYSPQEFAGPANLPDPLSVQERYTQTFSVGVRGTAL